MFLIRPRKHLLVYLISEERLQCTRPPVPFSELGPPTSNPASERCSPPRTQGGGRHSRFWGRGLGTQFRRRDEHFGALCTLCSYPLPSFFVICLLSLSTHPIEEGRGQCLSVSYQNYQNRAVSFQLTDGGGGWGVENVLGVTCTLNSNNVAL